MIRTFLYGIGGFGVVAIFFFGTLYVLNSRDTESRIATEMKSRDATRVAHAKLLKDALERYRAARGGFPVGFGDNPVIDLKTVLVGGGYLKEIPGDPLPPRTYRYTASDWTAGKRYGLLIPLEETGNCITGVGFEGNGWWAPAPTCAF